VICFYRPIYLVLSEVGVLARNVLIIHVAWCERCSVRQLTAHAIDLLKLLHRRLMALQRGLNDLSRLVLALSNLLQLPGVHFFLLK